MVTLIHALDPACPVTCGLHMDSLYRDNGLRVDEVFAETDVAVMHSYPMYAEWARGPLDPDMVPYSCAVVEALCGKPVLMEEWGGCTAARGAPSRYWQWEGYGRPPMQHFMAAEEEMAAYFEAVLPRLVAVGATGALPWCFADVAPELWERPPYRELAPRTLLRAGAAGRLAQAARRGAAPLRRNQPAGRAAAGRQAGAARSRGILPRSHRHAGGGVREFSA